MERVEPGHFTGGYALVDPDQPDDGERVDYRPTQDSYYIGDGYHAAVVSARLVDALVNERLKQRGMRAVPLRPEPDPACVAAGHVVPGANGWVDCRTLKTNGCQPCRKFWGDVRDTGVDADADADALEKPSSVRACPHCGMDNITDDHADWHNPDGSWAGTCGCGSASGTRATDGHVRCSRCGAFWVSHPGSRPRD